jgi:hypothetical protein
MSRSKYGAKPVTIDGIRFASMKEGEAYHKLRLREKLGLIVELELQPAFPVHINGVKIFTYRADFRFRDSDYKLRVVDVKGVRTPVYRLKKKAVEAYYPGMEIEEW